MSNKKRLDLRLHELYPHNSRSRLVEQIAQGHVTVDGHVVTKSSTLIDEESLVLLHEPDEQYVCRAGHKLAAALQHFQLDVRGKTILDAGLSTGGFTDCLLQAGAAKIYGIDVGHGQVHEKIRIDERVIIMEHTNLRDVCSLPELMDIVTLDLSFISVLKVMDAVVKLCQPHAELVVLIKPQFEAGREHVGRGGLVKDEQVRQQVIETLVAGVTAHGFTCRGIIDSPILGGSGNKEYLAYFVR